MRKVKNAMKTEWNPGDRYEMEGKQYFIKDQLHEKLFLVEEIEPEGDDVYILGGEGYATRWELDRFAKKL